MEQNVVRMGRVGRVASGLVWVVQALLAASVVISVGSMLLNPGAFHGSAVLAGVSSLASTAGVMLILGLTLGLLKNLRSKVSPFCTQNVKRLRQMSVAMWLVAGVLFVTDLIVAFTISNITVATPSGEAVVVGVQKVAFQYTSFILVVVALVVWCVSLAFQHGAALQQQADETL